MTLQFETISDLIHMGKHGAYVWTAWILSLVCIFWLVAQTKRARTQFIKQQLAELRRKNKGHTTTLGTPQEAVQETMQDPSA